MTVIVTGGAGFLGRHLVQLLLHQGRNVVVLDSLWTGSMDNIRSFEGNEKHQYIIHDVREPLPEIADVEQIYHLACPASPDHFESSPVEILETCFQGTKNVLDFAMRSKARVLLASTSEIYGDPQIGSQSERYWGNVNSFGPRSCYDEGKRSMEALAFAYQSKHKLDIRVARIFNAYGPYMQPNDGRAVPNFIAAAMEGKPIEIYGDGDATRCFQFAGDCVRGLAALMNSNHGTPVNIGSDHEITVGEIANIISKVVATRMGQPTPTPVHCRPKRQDDPVQRKPDIGLAKQALDWRPEVTLDEGIALTVDWFIKRRKASLNGLDHVNALPNGK